MFLYKMYEKWIKNSKITFPNALIRIKFLALIGECACFLTVRSQ